MKKKEGHKTLGQSLISTIKDQEITNISLEVLESIVDSELSDGVLKDIPIIGSVIGLGKTYINIKNYFFLKKLATFISNIKTTTLDQRRKVISLLEDDPNQRIGIGEKLIYIIDKADDHLISEYVSQLFCAFVEELISYDQFLKGAKIINNMHLSDLEEFITIEGKQLNRTEAAEYAPHEDELPYINAGLIGATYNSVSLTDGWNYESMEKQKEISGGDVQIWLTTIGQIIRDNLTEITGTNM